MLVESALGNIDNLSPDYIARVLIAAIALGSTTLLKFRGIYKDLTQKLKENTIRCLAKLLEYTFGFSELYSTWLATNLSHLKAGSVELLAELDPEDYLNVKYSVVTNLNEPSEIRRFKVYVDGLAFQMNAARRNVLDNAVKRTMDEDIVLRLDQFRDVASYVLKLNLTKQEHLLKDL